MKLHLGAFDRVIPGWLNTDITPHLWLARIPFGAEAASRLGLISDLRLRQHIDGVFRQLRYLNIKKPFPFPPNSVEAIYTSHLLEHVPKADAGVCLRECHRVLKPGGVIRISVPDLDAMVLSYDPDDPDAFVMCALEPLERRAKNRHHYLYNYTSLARLLSDCGFIAINRSSFQNGRCPDIERIDCRPESLFVEAAKPEGDSADATVHNR